MSIGPTGLPGSIAGVPLAQTKGGEAERTSQDARVHERRTRYEQTADDAAGIGATDGEQLRADDRDADGRRLWEIPPHAKANEPDRPKSVPPAQDPTGERGSRIDLSG